MKEGIKELYKYKYSFKSHNEQGAHILRALQERKLLIDCPITQLPFQSILDLHCICSFSNLCICLIGIMYLLQIEFPIS